MESARYDALVVGAGPAGASAAYWLAQRGHSVLVVDKKRFPREKTCGDGLTPRAVRQLDDMGLAGQLEGFQRYEGLRSMAHGITLELRWPDAPGLPGLRLRRAPPRPRRDGGRPGGEGRARRSGRRARRSSRSSRAAWSPGRPIRRHRERGHRDGPGPDRRGRRRRELPLRPGARHLPGPLVPDGHGDSRLFHQSVPRRALDREPPRPAGPGRQLHARVRVDLPGR